MMFWFIAALLAAAVTAILLTPLIRPHKKLAFCLLAGIPLAALGLYLLLGNPNLPP